MKDICIYCGDELARMERNRSVCWECMDKTSETYEEEENEMKKI
jgi:predicted amidophosphoribosyltransferase